MDRVRLGVNVDHVATLRQARGTVYPDPVLAASLAELAGADQITLHLREDRRHIQDRDLRVMRETAQTPLNLEMAATDEMIAIAREVKPDQVTLVPERREELTTEGGLGVAGEALPRIRDAVARLQDAGIAVSLFIDPDPEQLDAAAAAGAPLVELHTGAYCEAVGATQAEELERLREAARHGHRLGLQVAGGHGLHYHNVRPVVAIPEIVELNIGHAIVARAVLVGFGQAVREMAALLER